MSQVSHIYFDFFGTLVAYSDSRTDQGYERSHSVLLSNGATLGYDAFLETWSATFAKFDRRSRLNNDEFSMDELVSEFLKDVLGRDADHEMVRVVRNTYLDEWNKGIQYIEGVQALLDRLAKDYTLALVTNTHSAQLVHGHLNAMGIAQSFSAIVTSVEHGKCKPHAAIFEEALKVTGGSAEKAVYVGDSFAADYVGANRVGMRCLLIDPDQKHNVPEEDRLTSVLDLPRNIEQS